MLESVEQVLQAVDREHLIGHFESPLEIVLLQLIRYSQSGIVKKSVLGLVLVLYRTPEPSQDYRRYFVQIEVLVFQLKMLR